MSFFRSTTDESTTPTRLRWTVWPLGGNKVCLWCLPALICAASLATWFATSSVASTALAAALLLMTFAPKLLPVTYVIHEAVLEIRSLGQKRFIEWRHVRAFRQHESVTTLYLPAGRNRNDARWASVRVPLNESNPATMPELRRRLSTAQELPAA